MLSIQVGCHVELISIIKKPENSKLLSCTEDTLHTRAVHVNVHTHIYIQHIYSMELKSTDHLG